MKRLALVVKMTCAMLLAGKLAVAQTLGDPTRPPAGFNLAVSGAKPADSPPTALVLESVLIHPDARSAIISGERVALGQKIRGLRLVRVEGAEVLLLGGGEQRRLKLYPGVQKKPAAARDRAPPDG